MDITGNEVSIIEKRDFYFSVADLHTNSPGQVHKEKTFFSKPTNNEGIWLSFTGWPLCDYWSMKRFSDDESYEGGGVGEILSSSKVLPSSNIHLCSNDMYTISLNTPFLYIGQSYSIHELRVMLGKFRVSI
jgi:hypothetical protein